MMLDNVIIHSSHAVQKWLAEYPHVHLHYGARYSPHDNPVERIWGSLKRYLANSPAPTMTGRHLQMRSYFNSRTPEQMLNTASPWSAPWLPQDYGQDFWQAA